MSMDSNRSILVIGGGPAGCMAALLLARSGREVRLLEKSAGPHDKVCGECLSGLGLEVLARAGLRDRIDRLKPARLTRTFLHTSHAKPIEVRLPRASAGITRLALDELLLAAAAEAGVTVTRSARCESIEPGHPPAVVWRNLTDNTVVTSHPDVAILADGKGLLSGRRPRPTGDLGIKTHLRNAVIPADSICLFSGRGWYGGLAAVEGGLVNAAISIKSDRLRQFDADVPRLFESLLEENGALSAALKNSEMVRPWLASPLPRFSVARHWPEGIAIVGNAAAAIEPIGGEGMGAALRSAELVARAIIEGIADGSDSRFNSHRFNSHRMNSQLNSLYAPRRLTCRSLARLFMSPGASRIAVPIARRIPALATTAAGWIGK